MAKLREAIWADGIVALGDEVLPDVIAFSVNEEFRNVTHKQGDGGGDVVWATGRKITGSITFKALTAEIYAALTGGTLTAGTTYSRVRKGDEGPTEIAVNIITLAHGADALVQEDSVELFGANGTVFKKVTDPPSGAGEFSYVAATGVCTFHADEIDTFIYPQYIWKDTSGGNKVEVGKYDVPSQMELWGTLRSKELNSADGDQSDMVIHLSKVNVTTGISLGGESSEETKDYAVEFSAIIDNTSDFEVYFGKY